jgi:hypothetical protein
MLVLFGFWVTLRFRRGCYLPTFFRRRFRRLLFDFSRRVAPGHDITHQNEYFVVLERFLHSLNPELNITDLGLVKRIDVDLTFFDGLLSKEFGLLSL